MLDMLDSRFQIKEENRQFLNEKGINQDNIIILNIDIPLKSTSKYMMQN